MLCNEYVMYCICYTTVMVIFSLIWIHLEISISMWKNIVEALKYPYICQVSRQLIENKNDLLKLIKPKWPPQPRFQSHMKIYNTNRLADPENLYIPGFEGILKKSLKKISRQVAAILIIGGKLKF